jgi:hypothetical protein
VPCLGGRGQASMQVGRVAGQGQKNFQKSFAKDLTKCMKVGRVLLIKQ